MLLLVLCLFGTLGGVVAQTSSSTTKKYVYPGTDCPSGGVEQHPNASTTLKNWGTNKDPCGYAGGEMWAGELICLTYEGGIVIDAAGNATQQINTSVIGMQFRNASLTGKIPSQISLLSQLSVLVLTNNPDLLGPLPKEIELLPLLSTLDLSGNSLSGELSSTNTSQLPNIYIMKIARNRFQGSIKQDYFQGSTLLQDLDLSMNNFTGLCPNFSTSRNLTNLDLSSNNFVGPLPDFKHLSKLKTLNVSSNRFTGLSHNLSSFWSTLPLGLSVLNLSSLEIKGPLPVWSTMTNSTLSELYLDNNHITGTLNVSELVASTIGKNLNVLSFRNNNISEIVSTNDLLQGLYMRIFMQGNPYCNNTWPSEDAATKCFVVCGNNCIYNPSAKFHNWKVILSSSIGNFAAMLMLAIVAFAFILCRNQKYTQVLLREIERADIGAKRFEYS